MPDAKDTNTDLATALSGGAAGPPEAIAPGDRDRFAIHRNNVGHARVETLRAIFPVVDQLVGQRFFAGLADAYIRHDPPRSPLLFRYGRGFAGFIEGFAPAASVPYLADIARIEWLRLQAYHAADATPLAIAALGQVPEERLPGLLLRLHPSLGLVRSRWPAFSIWAESAGSGAGPEVDMTRAEAAVILRPDLQVETHLLPPGGDEFLDRLGGGAALGPAAQAAADLAPEFDLSQTLQVVFECGCVISLEHSGGAFPPD